MARTERDVRLVVGNEFVYFVRQDDHLWVAA